MDPVRTTEPEWVLRHHMPHPVHDVHWYAPHQAGEPNAQPADLWLAAGDAQGQVSVTWLPTWRPRALWRAHQDSVLGVQLIDADTIVTQGRDHKLYVWRLPRHTSSTNTSTRLTTRAASTNPRLPLSLATCLPTPTRLVTVDINALNYCRFSLVASHPPVQRVTIAVPHTLESSYVDILRIDLEQRTVTRTWSALGSPDVASSAALRQSREAIVMAMQLFTLPSTGPLASNRKEKAKVQDRDPEGELYLLVGDEGGRITLWCQRSTTILTPDSIPTDPEDDSERYQALALYDTKADWNVVWTRQQHADAVLSLSLSDDKTVVCSTAADDVIATFPIHTCDSSQGGTQVETKRPGRACSALRSDKAVVAVGDWGGDVRLYNVPALVEQAQERFFRQAVQTLVFAPDLRHGALTPTTGSSSSEPYEAQYTVVEPDDSDSDSEDKHGSEPWRTTYDPRAGFRRQTAYRWLAAGGKDGRIAIWDLDYLDTPPSNSS